LRKGYIQLSKSPQTSLVFFVAKKDGKFWIDNIRKKKVFIKMDLMGV